MKAMRQDAWTEEDDKVLADIILRHIQEGSTQLAAFGECAERLGRTAAACGYRWNACVRKSYQSGIELARSKRKELKNNKKKRFDAILHDKLSAEEPQISWNDVLRFLKGVKQEHSALLNHVRQLEKELANREKELQDLLLANQKLESQLQKVSQEHDSIKKDYRSLVQIMERARKLTLFSGDLEDMQAATFFRMDTNGNLERME
ncbi:RsfA family transcriptional regulator [Effusibacillus lacus]|uniref:Precorrin-3B C(17)-methyltransferase n=1 Tax=Effusibacillus lacus TaxID=1348429 RepID=A0A292YNI7_9BACL|nr:RsfA family transcriptional regulator [Effusibacillus lacus]TCS69548.1 prespore-specific regulator [Effusibacillus lacus]GAX90045.1 precorrin-3B C(17)-methyltransferase [Effusibacillus lacus]